MQYPLDRVALEMVQQMQGDLEGALKSVVAMCMGMVHSLADKCERENRDATPEDIEDLADRIAVRFGIVERDDNAKEESFEEEDSEEV